MNNYNSQNKMYENTIAYRLRIFLDCYHISLRFKPLVLRPLAGTVIIFGIHTMGGGGLVFFYLVIMNLLWSTGGFFGKTKVGCPGASR